MSDNGTTKMEVVDEVAKLPTELTPTFHLGKLYEMYTAVTELERGCGRIPFKLAWKIDDLKELLKPFATKYELRLQKILGEFGAPSKKQSGEPGQITYEIKDRIKYQEAAIELYSLEEEFDATKLPAIAVDELEAAPEVNVSPSVLRALRTFEIIV